MMGSVPSQGHVWVLFQCETILRSALSVNACVRKELGLEVHSPVGGEGTCFFVSLGIQIRGDHQREVMLVVLVVTLKS